MHWYVACLYDKPLCVHPNRVAQGDMDLNICEAHAFNTNDRLVLDVFVVNGWQGGVRS